MNPSVTAAVAVQCEVTVNLAAARAFDLFTESMSKWWPATHHIAKEPFADIVMEPRAGGRWFERDQSAGECEWGEVLAWEPPSCVLLAWHLTPDWEYDPDPEHASQVEIRFIRVDAQTTRVTLEHSGFERHGAGAERMRESVASTGGWPQILGAFQQECSK